MNGETSLQIGDISGTEGTPFLKPLIARWFRIKPRVARFGKPKLYHNLEPSSSVPRRARPNLILDRPHPSLAGVIHFPLMQNRLWWRDRLHPSECDLPSTRCARWSIPFWISGVAIVRVRRHRKSQPGASGGVVRGHFPNQETEFSVTRVYRAFALIGSRCISDELCPLALRFVPLQADDILRARVFEHEWRVFRREAQPKSPGACHLEPP
jgi:hypothetical protein